MIKSWRAAFGDAGSALPFVTVILAPDQKANAVADIRQAQLAVHRNLSNTALVNTIDDGDCTPEYCAVHVRDKQLIGARLSKVLTGLVYTSGGIAAYKPAQTALAVSWEPAADVRAACSAGSAVGVTVHFENVGSGLTVVTNGRQAVCGGNTTKWKPSDGNVTTGGNSWPVPDQLCVGFELQAADGTWAAPTAPPVIADDAGTSIAFCSSSTTKYIGVRYAQGDWPVVTLYSKDGQPAAPFYLPQGPPVGPH